MLRGERIHRRHTGYVEDRDFRTGFEDSLKQRFHHDLRACAVERANHRKGQHAIPEDVVCRRDGNRVCNFCR
jgi:hypothetical protein